MRLLVDGIDVADVATPSTYFQKLRGLLGRRSLEGAMFFEGVTSVHTYFMLFTIDVAFVDRNMVVQRVQRMLPFQFTAHWKGVHSVLEAQSGRFAEWNLDTGSRIELQ